MPSPELLHSIQSNISDQIKKYFYFWRSYLKTKATTKQILVQSYIFKFTSKLRVKLSTKYLLIYKTKRIPCENQNNFNWIEISFI